jgi:hypothetical protein
MAEVQTHTEAGEMTQIFIEFVMMQAQNAALFLGQIPNPRGGQPEVNLPLAKMFIDQLAVIHAKTQGNLNQEEQRVLESAISQLDHAFMEVASRTEGFHAGESLAPPPEPAAAKPAPAAEVKPPPSPEPAPAPAEEGRKRFTKSYGA